METILGVLFYILLLLIVTPILWMIVSWVLSLAREATYGVFRFFFQMIYLSVFWITYFPRRLYYAIANHLRHWRFAALWEIFLFAPYYISWPFVDGFFARLNRWEQRLFPPPPKVLTAEDIANAIEKEFSQCRAQRHI